MLHEETTSQIIAAFYAVYNKLGYGFLERVYENALVLELRKSGLNVQEQVPIQVCYEGRPVGEYFADLLVEGKVIVEVKAADALVQAHENQVVNYLKATRLEVGLVLNFGPKPQFKRRIFTNDHKPSMRTEPLHPNSIKQ